MSFDAVQEAISRELNGNFAPSLLLPPINARLNKSIDLADVIAYLVDDKATQVRSAAASAFQHWDAEPTPVWAPGTSPKTAQRRHLIYALLDIPGEAFAHLDAAIPVDDGLVVITAPQPWDPWYTAERRRERTFYWDAYQRVLATSGWNSVAVSKLSIATSEVVSRLADPTRDEPYQSKGLVVGYVQSGKTANFTGVTAKAIDAGYRLIIVLTGTIELLRGQTQRRLDKELIGVQNIGASDDYVNDQEWVAGRFLTHDVDPNTSNEIPAIRRLTGLSYDFQRLGNGLGALHYEFVDHKKPLNHPENLFPSNVRIAVVKKNSSVLKKLVEDLGRIPTPLDQIPALIIDDEADQASVNTLNPDKWKADQIERTAINARIADLIRVLKRGQYVGYTATPFANVFVDPVDAENIFPKDFILSLERPIGYMGGADFHDFDDDAPDEDKTPRTSNENAFVRFLYSGYDDEGRTEEQQRALDSFVIAGATKLYRESKGAKPFEHHTMLVHESRLKGDHKALADEFKLLWRNSTYSQPVSLARLEKLWTEDFKPVSAVRAEEGVQSPATFAELEDFVGDCVGRVATGLSPVIVVNGDSDTEYDQDELNFEQHGVWKILVGGAKLSRGFTVEGLTTTYYSRRTNMADTLMQMGRWFGFRRGYRDLVRLYIGRNVPGPAGKPTDMYHAFETIVRDEEEFRAELRRFAITNNEGEPMMTPRDVPPMVFQSQPWLKPTAANKMYNAEQAYRGVGGEPFSFTMQPPRGNGDNNKAHFDAVKPLLQQLSEPGVFNVSSSRGGNQTFDALYGIVPAEAVRDAVRKFVWDSNWKFGPHLEAMDTAIKNGLLDEFVVLLPRPRTRPAVPIKGWEGTLPLVNRRRQDRDYRTGFTGTAVREREVIAHIAGSPEKNGGPLAAKLHTPTRGGMILVFANDPNPRFRGKAKTGPVNPVDFATLFSYALPYAAEPTPRVGFRVKKDGQDAIVDAT